MAKNKEVKPLPIWLGLLLVVLAFVGMAVFAVYLFGPSESTLGNGNLSAVGGFSEDENTDPNASYGNVIDVSGGEDGKLKINAEINDVIVFGKYNNEPIHWIVVDKKGNELLLVSRYCLDIRPYNSERKDVAWLDSSLSKWLCGEFYNNAFSDEFKNSVIEKSDLGKVFVLSSKEAKDSFEYDSWRAALPAKGLAASKGLTENKAVCQWLRDSGNIANSASYVYFDGSIRSSGYAVDYNEVGVRPAIWISTGYASDSESSASSEITE